MKVTKKYIDELTYAILGCAIEVHKQLGPGLLESIYEKCFLHELCLKGMKYKSQQKIDVCYKGVYLDAELRYDVLVESIIIVELKSIESILPIHQSILLTYMKLLERPKGVLINFNCMNIFKEGQKTMVNEYYAAFPSE